MEISLSFSARSRFSRAGTEATAEILFFIIYVP